jgi:CheY-like chemotaxis protein
VFGIVQQSGGNIWAYSEPGEGTTIKVYLPQQDSACAPAMDVVAESPVRRGSETILLVEDEGAVHTLVRTILERHGYRVLEALSGGDALLICEQHTATIHVLLTDVVMPRMRGPELARRVQQKLPHVKVVFISGYTEEIHGTTNSLNGGSFLQKPFSRAQLLQKLSDALHSQKPSKPLHAEKVSPIV